MSKKQRIRSLAEGWKEVEQSLLLNAPVNMREQLRRMYYIGATAALTVFVAAAEDDDCTIIERISDECENALE